VRVLESALSEKLEIVDSYWLKELEEATNEG